MKNPLPFLTLFSALLCAQAPAASPWVLPEPGPFRIIPASASEPLMFYGGNEGMWGVGATVWRGSTLYGETWPVEFEHARVSLAQPYSFSAEAFHQQIRFLYMRPAPEKELPAPQRYQFYIGYQF